MKSLFTIPFLLICFIAGSQTIQYYQTGEEFSGPFASWKNIKTDFGAKGDGVTNDAPAINAALAAVKSAAAKDSFNVLYFPAGTYLINDSLYNAGGGYDGLAIIGEDPATTIISWNGKSGGNMFQLQGWYLRVSRLTFEGNNNALRGIFKAGAFSTHNEFSDLVFKDFKNGIGLDLSGNNQGQAENAIIRCTFLNCASGIASCNWNSLDQWVWNCLFEDCNLAINQCDGYFQIYNNVFLRSKTYDIGSSPYKNAIVNNISINSKCFFNGYGVYLRGNKIYSNVDSFYTKAGSGTVMLDNIIRTTRDSWATVRTGSSNMIIGNTFSTILSQWKKWPLQPAYQSGDHGFGGSYNLNKQIEKAIDGNPATSFAVQNFGSAGIKWNCPAGTKRTVVKYTVSAPPSGNHTSPVNFQLLGSNNWGFKWDTLDLETNQNYTGGANPVTYNIKNKTSYGMYELLSLSNNYAWQQNTAGGRSIVNTGAENGTYCEQIKLAPAPRTVFQNINIKADSSYLVSGWMKSTAVVTNVYMLVLWYNKINPPPPASGYPAGFIKSDTIGIITGTNGWTNYSKTVTAPANALSAQLFLESDWISTSAGTAWLDNFSFNPVKDPSKNLLIDPGFESGINQQWFEVNELTLLDSLGNDLTKDNNGLISGADELWGQYYPLDNKIVDSMLITVPASISITGTPLNKHRKIFEVVAGTGDDANEIQNEINLAALEATGTKPVVHIPIGQFNIKRTITVPAVSDMQIIGDGLGTGTTTRLVWAGDKIGPLLSCEGPSRVTIKDLLLNVPYANYVGPEALVIKNADQAGGRIFGNNFYAGGPQWTQPCDIGLLSDSIENSDITMICSYPGFGSTANIQANGGPVLSSGGNTQGQISFLAGATGDCQNIFNVTGGGRIDAEGMWNEGDITASRTSGLVNLSNTSGKISLACMSWIINTPLPMLQADNFSGTFTLLLNHFNQTPQTFIPLTGDGSDLNVLSAYNDLGASSTVGGTTDSTWQDMTSPNANSNFIGNTSIGGRNLDVVVKKVHNILPDSTSVLNDLAQLRAVRTDPPNDRIAGVTDVKFFRVAAWGTKGKIAAHFHGSGNATGMNVLPASKTDFISLYPTVTQKYYTVSFNLPCSENVSFIVYDIFGRKISEKTIEESKGNHQSVFSVEGLDAGTYFMRFQSGNTTETKKFIVTK